MNNTTPDTDGDRDNLRYAEYVLGVLDADARAAVAHEIATSDEAATAVALWQRRLMPLAEILPAVAPSDDVWTRIRQALHWDVPGATGQRSGFWDNLRLWHWIGAGASLVAAACVVLLVITPLQRPAE